MSIIKSYFDRPGSLKRAEVCEAMNITQGRLSQLRDSVDWPPELALKMESVTRGAINASDISPLVAKARATGVAA